MQQLKTHQIPYIFLLFYAFFNYSCKKEQKPVHIYRFEQDLFNPGEVNKPGHFEKLHRQYGYFYDTYAIEMLNIDASERAEHYAPSLSQFINHPGIRKLKHEVDSVFPDIQFIENSLSAVRVNYESAFPNERFPSFVTYISEFYLANAITDTMIGIGLDFYLGENYSLYPLLEFPQFMVKHLRKEYLVPNTVKAIAVGKYESQLKDKRFLAMMLFEGKLKYFSKMMLPETPDSLIFGISEEQLRWCKANEAMIWTHYVQNKILFDQDPSHYMRYFNDGPFTIATGVPQESAPMIGAYTGYRIIEKYMKENSSVTIKELMEDTRWDELLKESAYKPE